MGLELSNLLVITDVLCFRDVNLNETRAWWYGKCWCKVGSWGCISLSPSALTLKYRTCLDGALSQPLEKLVHTEHP